MDNFEEAVKEAIRVYFLGMEPTESYKTQEGHAKFNKKHMDSLETSQFGDKTSWDEWETV